MSLRSIVAVSVLGLAVAACGPQESASDIDGTWVGTITTEGNVTTVVTESGSVWGGTATLVEEASIGVENGADEYMFGAIAGIGVADDRFYVLDSQVFRLRVYDSDGTHVMDLGSEGGGPGEFRVPNGLAVGQRVYVRDAVGRITVFSLEGEFVDTWPIRPSLDMKKRAALVGLELTPIPIVATTSGELFVPDQGAMVPWGPEGQAGPEVAFPEVAIWPPQVPFWPSPAFAMSPTGAMVQGVADQYDFVIEQPSGVLTRVESFREAVGVAQAEAAWHRSRFIEYRRNIDAGWQWDGPEIPGTKPALNQFVPTATGEVWVLRSGPGYEATDCVPEDAALEAPEGCWKEARILDAFGADGRFLGEIDVPDDLRFEPRPVIRGDMVAAVVQNEAGTIMVKRYRLVLPGER